MTVATQAPPVHSSSRASGGDTCQRLELAGVTWQAYLAIGQALADRPALRLTFDRGLLEFMTTSPQHEVYKKWLGRFVEATAEEFGLRITTAGNMTFQREDLERGLEADDCFWVAHEAQMRGRLDWDPAHDPPPDLVLEIEVSRRAVTRMEIYAALGIPEVWCWDGLMLRVHLLQSDGTYRPSPSSPTFPVVPFDAIARFLPPRQTEDYLSGVRALRTWLRGLPRSA